MIILLPKKGKKKKKKTRKQTGLGQIRPKQAPPPPSPSGGPLSKMKRGRESGLLPESNATMHNTQCSTSQPDGFVRAMYGEVFMNMPVLIHVLISSVIMVSFKPTYGLPTYLH